MTDADLTILDLKREFICEAMDVVPVYAAWTSRYLQQGGDALAVEAFAKLVGAIKSAAGEMAAIRATLPSHDDLTSIAAAEHRAAQHRSLGVAV